MTVVPATAGNGGGLDMPEAIKGVDQLCTEQGLNIKHLAERSGLDEGRVLAIALGRWTPSPQERDAIAKVFGLTRAQIGWGHKTPIQHIYGAGPG
jgi:transcriptional regulator with XRE-family HTH domain